MQVSSLTKTSPSASVDLALLAVSERRRIDARDSSFERHLYVENVILFQ